VIYDQFKRDLAAGYVGVYIRHALSLKYLNIETECAWQFTLSSLKYPQILILAQYTGITIVKILYKKLLKLEVRKCQIYKS
jgi:hypothetical protein